MCSSQQTKKRMDCQEQSQQPILDITNKNLREFFHTNPYWHATHTLRGIFFLLIKCKKSFDP
jgi:hypothetical protein